MRIAVDIGGTFTDLVASAEDGGEMRYVKCLTTPGNLTEGIANGFNKAGLEVASATHVIHGSTIAINTVIEQKGALTGLVTTRGFRDVYEIGRSNRPDAYNLFFKRPVPLVPRDLRVEVDERINSKGEVLEELHEDSARNAVRYLKSKGVVSIAVVLLHAYANSTNERKLAEIIFEEFPEAYVSLSHQILREFREYERTSTTVLNAYIAPIVSKYIADLQSMLKGSACHGNFLIMQSNGGAMSAELAKSRPVTIMESGPVAGVLGAAKLGRVLGHTNVISFDMGGTTAKSSLIVDGEAKFATGYHIGGYASGHPMMLPVVDITEVGAGGGSIAWIDASGGLKVGPISAGANPGPICYDLGGSEPTVTDANLVLGRLNAQRFLGGQMQLNLDKAREAIWAKIANPLRMSLEDAALGILKIVDTKMSLAVREVSVAKGYDPRDFALVAFGGAGPLHAVSIAKELSIPRVIVPNLPGNFSAIGMLLADLRHDFVQTHIAPMSAVDLTRMNALFHRMAEEGTSTLKQEGIDETNIQLCPSMDLRYQGQEYTLSVPVRSIPIRNEDLMHIRNRFNELHQARYSHSAPEEPVEIVNLRLSAVGPAGVHEASYLGERRESLAHFNDSSRNSRSVYFEDGAKPLTCGVYDRAILRPGEVLEGPAIVEEYASTTVLFPGDRATISESGAIIIDVV